jgi:hypothetical protein
MILPVYWDRLSFMGLCPSHRWAVHAWVVILFPSNASKLVSLCSQIYFLFLKDSIYVNVKLGSNLGLGNYPWALGTCWHRFVIYIWFLIAHPPPKKTCQLGEGHFYLKTNARMWRSRRALVQEKTNGFFRLVGYFKPFLLCLYKTIVLFTHVLMYSHVFLSSHTQ